jgi:RNA polymerase sigma factor (TIGR02999 family)
MSADSHAVTLLLHRIQQGSSEAKNELVALISDRLRQLAHHQRRHERPGHSLTTGDLVQEGVLRLLKDDEIARAANRNQLFRAFARAVRQLLIDHARKRDAARRGGGRQREELNDLVDDVHRRSQVEALALHEALEALGAEHPVEAEVVELRFFGGFEMAEIAETLGLSLSSVERAGRYARAWLHDFLTAEGSA